MFEPKTVADVPSIRCDLQFVEQNKGRNRHDNLLYDRFQQLRCAREGDKQQPHGLTVRFCVLE